MLLPVSIYNQILVLLLLVACPSNAPSVRTQITEKDTDNILKHDYGGTNEDNIILKYKSNMMYLT